MDTKRLPLLLILLIAICLPLSAQKGYYITKEGQRVEGVRLRNQGPLMNAKECLQIIDDLTYLPLKPDQILEYGYRNAATYHSKMIIKDEEPVQVFLRLLVDGNMKLYYYVSKMGKRFFLEDEEGGLIELLEWDPDDRSYDYKRALEDICRDCIYAIDELELVKYTQSSLTQFIEKYNACDERPLPRLRYGTFGGWNLSNLSPSHSVENPLLLEASFPWDGNFMAGAFLDVPLPARNVFLHIEGYFSSGDYWFEKITENYDTDVLINQQAITFPLMIRYVSPRRIIRPFFNAGIHYTYFLNNNSGIRQTAFDNAGDTVSTYILNTEPIFESTQIGAGIGGGTLVELSEQISLFAEARYHTYSIRIPAKQRLFRREILLMAGIMF